MQDYWDALERLKSGCPCRVPLGSSINKDTVALEAGRKRGSIKKSRSSFGELIAAIDTANGEVDVPANLGICFEKPEQRSKITKNSIIRL